MTLTHMTLDEFLHMANGAKRLTIYREVMADRLTPIGIFEQLSVDMQEGTLLESGLHQTEDGRYSYLYFGLMAQLSAQGHQVRQRIGSDIHHLTADPFTVLRQMVADLSCGDLNHELLGMQGAVGFLTYDAVRLLENIPDRHHAEHPLPDLMFNFYHTALIFDHMQQKLLLAKTVDLNTDHVQIYQETQTYLDDLVTKINQPKSGQETLAIQNHSASAPEVTVSDAQFMQYVEQAKEYITAGDVFQIVLSRCFKQSYSAQPFDIYRALRKVSPAPYMFYFPLTQGVMIGASPEKLITVRQGQVEINPIAGTRQRASVEDEANNKNELLTDEKELAEHMMLVDLARNDLGAVCEPGSVQIKELLQVKHFSHVSHLTSVVTGRLQANHDALDALRATFPAGTVSGAPKIRAMQLIDDLENSKRGMYGGALCRLDAQGNFDSCLAIRMAILREGIATIRTGAGIVADSNPESESAETRQKAQGLLDAIALAEGGFTC